MHRLLTIKTRIRERLKPQSIRLSEGAGSIEYDPAGHWDDYAVHAIPVHCLEAADRFYRDVVGGTARPSELVNTRGYEIYGQKLVCFDVGHDYRCVDYCGQNQVPRPNFGFRVSVADYDALTSRLRAHDVRVTVQCRVQPAGGKPSETLECFFKDPSNNNVFLTARVADLPLSPTSVAPGVDFQRPQGLHLPKIGLGRSVADSLPALPPPPRTPNRGPASQTKSPPRWSNASDKQMSKLSVAGRRCFLSWSASSPKAAAPKTARAPEPEDDVVASETRRRSRTM